MDSRASVGGGGGNVEECGVERVEEAADRAIEEGDGEVVHATQNQTNQYPNGS